MSVIPANESLDLIQGSAFDEDWEVYDDEAQTIPHDFTGEVATLRIGKDDESAALITLTSVGKVTWPTDGNGIYLTTGHYRFYITAATLAALTEAQFKNGGCDEGFTGRNTLILTSAAPNLIPSVENDGSVTFTPIVQP